MTDEHGEPRDDAEHPLDALAWEHDDPELFPDEVRTLYDAGKARKARQALLRLARQEPDEARSALQDDLAEHPRLWLDPLSKPPKMYTINGFGTMLYGRSSPAADGTHIATLWFVLLFVPVWPLGSYLVAPAKGGGWFFLAKAPFSRLALGVRRFALVAAIAIAFRITWGMYWSGTHADLIVYNGFDQPVTVTVADDRDYVDSGSHVVFQDLPFEPTSIEARWLGEDTPFESLSFDFTGHGDHKLIYNIANRGTLRIDYILYGDGMSSEGRWLDRGPVNVVREPIDYLFVDPPESKRVSEGSTLENSVLYDPSAGDSAIEAVGMLMQNDRDDHALQVARAALMADPTDARLALVTAFNLLVDDLSAQLELFRELIDRSPNTVDLHRYYQGLWPDARQDGVKAEYATLLAEHPSDPMYHYLAGRLEESGSQAAATHYDGALALDPDYPPVHRAFAYDAVQAGAWATALQHYERYAAVDPAGGVDVLDERARIGRRLGKPTSEIVSLFTNAPSDEGTSFNIQRLLAHLRVAGDPRSHTEAAESLYQYVVASISQEPPASLRLNLQADAAITAGALDQARAFLGQIANPAERSPDITLRLLQSSGATPGDEQLLSAIPRWYDELDLANKFPALALLNPEALALAVDEFDERVRDIVDLLQSANQLRGTDRMIEATRSIGMKYRVTAYFAASRVLQSVPGSERAYRFYVEEAYAMALPGELPHRGR